MLNQATLTSFEPKTLQYAKVEGTLKLTLKEHPELENTKTLNVVYNGKLPTGRAYEMVQEHCIIGNGICVAPKELGKWLGARVRHFEKNYKPKEPVDPLAGTPDGLVG